MPQVEGQISR